MKYIFWGLGKIFHSNEYVVDWDSVVAIIDNRVAVDTSLYHGIEVVSQDKLGLFEYDQIVIFSDNRREEIYDILVNKLGADRKKIVPYQDYIYRDRKYNRYRCAEAYKRIWDGILKLPINTVYDKCNTVGHYTEWSQELCVGNVNVIIEDESTFPLTDLKNDAGYYDQSLDLYLDWFEKYESMELDTILYRGTSRYVAINIPISLESYSINLGQYRVLQEDIFGFGRCLILDRKKSFFEISDDSKLSVYVVSHKKGNEIDMPGYKYIQAGTELNGTIGYQNDNEGDNISHLNKHINECTALYWIWKHDKDSDYIGLNHYRRFFQEKGDEEIISEGRIKAILKDYDIIVPVFGSSYPATVMEFMRDTVSEEAFEVGYKLVRESMIKCHPDYMDAFDQVLSQYWFFCCNMFITRREILDEYCEWLFEVIIPICDKFDVEKYDNYSCRMIGFFAERMLTVWLLKHSYKVKVLPILQTESESEKKENPWNHMF